MIRHTIPFTGGMNSDVAPEYLPQGDYTYALNCRSGETDNGNIGHIENIPGNVLVSFTVPAGTNTVLGTGKDIRNDKIVFCVYNSNNNHCIFQYDIKTNTVGRILYEESILNFNPNYPVYDINVVSGLLLFNDRYNPPRKINIEKAYNYTNSTGTSVLDSYLTIDEQTITAMPYAPGYSPSYTYNSDSSINYNNLRGYQWQFQYQWVYDDGEHSTWSPFSKIEIPENEVFYNGNWNPVVYINNRIDLLLWTGHEKVQKINIAARNTNTGDTFLVDTITKYNDDGTMATDSGGAHITNNAPMTYFFYNDKSQYGIDQSQASRLFNWVPQKALSQEVVGGNRVCYGGPTEGYDNVKMDLTVDWEWYDPEIIDNYDDLIVLSIPYSFERRSEIVVFPNITPSLGDSFAITLKNPDTGGIDLTVTEIINDTDILPGHYPNDIRNRFRSQISGLKYVTGGTYFIEVHDYTDNPFYCVTNFMLEIITLDELVSPEKLLLPITARYYVSPEIIKMPKTGAFHEWGVVYYDKENRSGAVNLSNDSRVYIPTLVEDGQTGAYVPRFLIDIGNVPPLWANKYQLVYTKNTSISTFTQFAIHDISDNMATGYTAVDINQNITDTRTKYPKLVIPDWIFQKGDRVRFIQSYINAPLISYKFAYLGEYIDVEVMSQDPSNGVLIIENFDWASKDIADFTVVEVYRPMKDLQDKIFYEFGQVYDILDAGLSTRRHSGTINQVVGVTPARVIIEDGDVYFKLRVDADNRVWACESSTYDDFHLLESISIGRVNLELNDFNRVIQKELIANVRYGGKLLENTLINQLFDFDYLNYVSLQEKNGAIYKMKEVGYTLKVLQKAKVTSLYIERTSSFNPDGTEDILLTSSVIGTIRPASESYGTIFPDSVIEHDRNLYFYDVYSGKVVRDSVNGMFAISDYGMKTFWKQRSKDILADLPRSAVHAGFDERYNEYVLTASTYGVTDRTITFHEPSNRWKSFVNYIADKYADLGLEFLTFRNGEIYRHNVNTLFNNFNGVQYNQEITIVANNSPAQIKTWLAIAVHSNSLWSCPVQGDISIPANATYPNGMQSRLLVNKFVLKEGISYCEFLNDMLDPRFATPVEALLNGRNLKGNVIIVKLTNTSTDYVTLFLVDINSNISPYS